MFVLSVIDVPSTVNISYQSRDLFLAPFRNNHTTLTHANIYTSFSCIGALCLLEPCDAEPPLRPASLASSTVHSCALPLACAALPPLEAILRCLAGSILANPLSCLAITFSSSFPFYRRLLHSLMH